LSVSSRELVWALDTLHVDGVALTPRQCIRSFQLTADGRHHPSESLPLCGWSAGDQNLWPLATTRGVFVEASFSWGSPAVAGETPFPFEMIGICFLNLDANN
jgi:hypothetical protein